MNAEEMADLAKSIDVDVAGVSLQRREIVGEVLKTAVLASAIEKLQGRTDGNSGQS